MDNHIEGRIGDMTGSLDEDEESESAPIPRFSFTDADHPTALLHSLNMMRRNKTFCDLILQVGNAEIHAHRVVLASVSPHLMELFSSEEKLSNEPIISYKLNGAFEKSSIERLVDYAYSSRLDLELDETKKVFIAAHQLKIDRIARACAQFLANSLTVHNAIEIRALPGIHKYTNLIAKIDDFISEKFGEIVKTPEFLSLLPIPIEILSQSEREMKMLSGRSVCQMAFDWLAKAHEEITLQDLVDKTHMLYLALDNSLQDCSELPSGDVGDTELVQDYKRHSKNISNGNKQKKQKAAVSKPRVLMYSRNISNDSETVTQGKLVAATDLKDQTLVGLGFLSGKAVSLSVLLRLNVEDTDRSLPGPEPDLYAELKSMDNAKCGAGCAALNGKLLVCGGYDRGECLKNVELYSPDDNIWTPLSPMLEARGRFNIAVIGDKVYAVGGCNGTTELSTVEVLEGDRWSRLTVLPTARSHLSVAVLGSQLYCVGGDNGQAGVRQAEVYDTQAKEWRSIAPLLTGRYQCGCCAFQDKVWAAGGSDGWANLTSVEIYTPHSDSWTYGPSMSVPRRGCGLAVFNGKLYAVGGSDGSQSLKTTEVYDPKLKSWLPGPEMSVARANVGVAVINRRLYAVGGFNGKTFLNSIEFLDENTHEWSTFSIKKD